MQDNKRAQQHSTSLNITQHMHDMHDMHDKHVMHSCVPDCECFARNVAQSVHMTDKNLKNKYCEFK